MLDPTRFDGDLSRPLQLLTVREAEVLEFASLGLTNEQVAHRLHVTVHAVKFHLASVYRKLGVANRTEAAVAYLRSNAGRPPASEGLE
jgi:two-component system, NarL family, response regulator LiaR